MFGLKIIVKLICDLKIKLIQHVLIFRNVKVYVGLRSQSKTDPSDQTIFNQEEGLLRCLPALSSGKKGRKIGWGD